MSKFLVAYQFSGKVRHYTRCKTGFFKDHYADIEYITKDKFEEGSSNHFILTLTEAKKVAKFCNIQHEGESNAIRSLHKYYL